MKQYLLDEDDLRTLAIEIIEHEDEQYSEETIKDFLKSKTPVEEIASGEIGYWLFKNFKDYVQQWQEGNPCVKQECTIYIQQEAENANKTLG